jgi:uncharacterized protein (DUF2141 family)
MYGVSQSNCMTKTKVVLATGVGLFLALATACSSNKTAESTPVKSGGDGKGTAPASAAAKQVDKALVRFVNGTADSKDLAFGDLTPFTGVGSFDVTQYKEIPADRHEFKLFAKDQTAEPLATNSEGLSAGKHYTILAVTEKSGKATLDPVVDDLTPPSPAMAKVRVINLAPRMKDADLYAGGKKDALISGAGLDHPTSYKDVSPSEAALYLRNSTSKKNSVRVEDVSLKAGKLYTILVFQDKHGKVKVKTIEDEFTAG